MVMKIACGARDSFARFALPQRCEKSLPRSGASPEKGAVKRNGTAIGKAELPQQGRTVHGPQTQGALRFTRSGSIPPQAAITACARGGREARGNTPRWNAARRAAAGGCASRRLSVLSVRASGSARRRHHRPHLLYPGLELGICRAKRCLPMNAFNRNIWRFIL